MNCKTSMGKMTSVEIPPLVLRNLCLFQMPIVLADMLNGFADLF